MSYWNAPISYDDDKTSSTSYREYVDDFAMAGFHPCYTQTRPGSFAFLELIL